MKANRASEIALQLQEHRYRNLGTERYMGELKASAYDLNISEDEMLEFFKKIFWRITKK